MSRVNYSRNSPYYSTSQNSSYLLYWTPPAISRSVSDTLITLTIKYTNRPDLLSNDLYGTPRLWWIFAMLNPDVIRDPLFDFKANVQIYVPSKSSIQGFV